VLDWANEYAESTHLVEEARALVERIGDRRLELRFWGALGRSYYHQERQVEAIELLRRSADGAKESDDYETRVVSLLLLAPLLGAAGRLDEANERFSEVIRLCTEAEDRLHLSVVYVNRATLWITQKLRERSMDDLRRAIQLAREVGNPLSECIATNNVAEFLHWLGEADEALVMTRRVRVLEQRFMERPVADGSLLLARIQATRGDFDEAAQCVRWISEHCRPTDSEPSRQAFFEMMRLILDYAGVPSSARKEALVSWSDVVLKVSEGMFTEELLEVLYWRARIALGKERWEEAQEAMSQVQQRLDECPMWHFRFADLASRLILRQPVSLVLDSRSADDFK